MIALSFYSHKNSLETYVRNIVWVKSYLKK